MKAEAVEDDAMRRQEEERKRDPRKKPEAISTSILQVVQPDIGSGDVFVAEYMNKAILDWGVKIHGSGYWTKVGVFPNLHSSNFGQHR